MKSINRKGKKVYNEWLIQNGKGNGNGKTGCLKSKIVDWIFSAIYKAEIKQCTSELDFIKL